LGSERLGVRDDSSLAANVGVKSLKVSLGGGGLATTPDAEVGPDLHSAGAPFQFEKVQNVVEGLEHSRVLEGFKNAGVCFEVRHKSGGSAKIGSVRQLFLNQGDGRQGQVTIRGKASFQRLLNGDPMGRIGSDCSGGILFPLRQVGSNGLLRD